MSHDPAINFVLSNPASLFMAIVAGLLTGLYVLQYFFIKEGWLPVIRKEGLAVRAINWAIFGFVFLLFGRVIPLQDVLTWRASARLALLSLMISELMFLSVTSWPTIKRLIWTRDLPPS